LRLGRAGRGVGSMNGLKPQRRAPDLREKIDFKTIIENVSAVAKQEELDVFLEVVRGLSPGKCDDMYRFVIAVARHGFEDGKRK
jgi:hypothetical protein